MNAPLVQPVSFGRRLEWAAVGALRAFHARALVALIMVIMGLGRLGLYTSRPLAEALPNTTYGALLVGIGGALLVTHRWRHGVLGRVVDALGAILLAGMAWDAWAQGGIGVTPLIELVMALSLLGHCLLNHDR